ncbi:hypothetical protein KGF54_002632 [Candida jiufengensis]|uniref:uncharacterized protein n=1 Tax=Candida jiufengensis TaxID=497108 RepID=UPI002224C68A|nr:uncharacterized protein KGF54_002632 [Candida jiufengensis]KAI5953261.1 hypothetical protein KGF54_002632 [Candida jiufengensis]
MTILNKILNLKLSNNDNTSSTSSTTPESISSPSTPSSTSIDQHIIDSGFEISDCSETCEDCTFHYPKSLKFEENEPLWHSTKPFGLHLNISTGKTDWPHDATGLKGTLSNKIANWASEKSGKTSIGNIKVTCSSLGNDELLIDDEYIQQKKGDVLILPYFLWIKGIYIDEVDEIFNKLLNIIDENNLYNKQTNQQQELKFETIKQQIPTIIEDENKAYVLFCSHKTRDKRCGITAPIMKKEMDLYLREVGLYRDFGDLTPGGVKIAFINHIGGHKFAANVIIYLKNTGQNIWLGLCKPNNVKPIVDQCIIGEGKVWPVKVRILQKFNPIEW